MPAQPTDRPPDDLVPLLQHSADYIREVQALLQRHGIRSWTGPLPTR